MATITEYTDHQGKVFKPLYYTENYVYYRSDFHGHIECRMHRITDEGEVVITRLAKGFRNGFHNPTQWMMENSEGMPQQYISGEIKERVGAPETAEQKAQVQAENMKRLQESRQKLLDVKKPVDEKD